jgi:hypothetical protein
MKEPNDESGSVELGEPDAFDDASRWRDWLQPILLGDTQLSLRRLKMDSPTHRSPKHRLPSGCPPRLTA